MSEAKLVVVYNDCTKPVSFKRSDTNERTGCPDCSAFTSEGTCMMERVRSCWPLYDVACSEWSLRSLPHETRPCEDCGKPIEKYRSRRLCPPCENDARLKLAYAEFRLRRGL